MERSNSSLGYFVEAMSDYRQQQNAIVMDDFSVSFSGSTGRWAGTPTKSKVLRMTPDSTHPRRAVPSPKTAERVQLMQAVIGVSLFVFALSLYWSRRSNPILKRLVGFFGMLGGVTGTVYGFRRRVRYVDLADEAMWKRFRDEATACTDFPRFVRRVLSHIAITAGGEERPLDPTVISQHRLFRGYPFVAPGHDVEGETAKLAEAVVNCDRIYARRKAIIDVRAWRQLKESGRTGCWDVGKNWYEERRELRHTFQYVEQTLQQEFLDLRYMGLLQKPLFTVNVDPLDVEQER